MQKEKLISAMKTSISEVLETMFFMPLEFTERENLTELWPAGAKDVLVTRLNFKGPFSGRFHLYIPRTTGLELAASFLGEDEGGVSENQVVDTIKEIINMIAGNTFSHYDDQALFDLDIPESITFDQAGTDSPGQVDEVFVPVDTLENCLAFQMVITA